MTKPRVSIVLPTYNRSGFLPQAFQSIKRQTFKDWELIIVDDGSTDDSAETINRLSKTVDQPVKCVFQENRGAYAARNTGLDHANGEFVAFFDSDDEWYPHHLHKGAEALAANPDVDWVFSALRRKDVLSGRIVEPHSFYTETGEPKEFLSLNATRYGDLYIIEDDRLLQYAISGDCPCGGLHKSILRRDLFQGVRFKTEFSECEDQIFVMRVIAQGRKLAYFNDIHLNYNIHNSNSSLVDPGAAISKRIEVMEGLLRGLESLVALGLNRQSRRAVSKRLGNECFWTLGYASLWENGERSRAFQYFWRGIKYDPLSLPKWKTFLLCAARRVVCCG